VLAIAANADEFVGAPGGVDLSVVFATGINPLLVGFLVWGIGLSLGGPTGYAINPARDLGPRIAHAFLPIPNKGGSDWGYALVPVLGPIAGGIVGAVAFRLAFG
jgi:glycerol uptake facilitator protein